MSNYQKKFVLIILLLILARCKENNSIKSENTPPSCKITILNENEEYFQGDTLIISVDATDDDGEIKRVNIYINDVNVYTTVNPPYTFYWSTSETDIGDYIIIATAIDDNNEESSDNLTIQIFDKLTDMITDIEGNVYKTVKIGDQWWMAENLKVTKYRNGESIINIINETAWIELDSSKIGAYCFYDNNENNGQIYGYLYNWFSINDSRNIAPEGWHVATDEDWKQLEMYIGLTKSESDTTGFRGHNEGNKLKATYLWKDDKNGTDDFGFSALPAGIRAVDGKYYSLEQETTFWTSTEERKNGAWNRILNYEYSSIYRARPLKNFGCSVRCVKN